ncbi:saposin domain-containing protein [Streptomyces sp. SUK 48]|uniref:saposin domain-containing protein n=1 Tax=Streptomyces sp. SUK 48 TaxID=2582831 RepID=UPI00129B8BDA|nr:saposin domain-containing protein [Streptomyces sp. SUK 48]
MTSTSLRTGLAALAAAALLTIGVPATALALPTGTVSAAAAEEDAPATCALCLYLISGAEERIDNGASPEQALDQAVAALPASLRPAGQALVDTYRDRILDLLKAGFSPQDICLHLGLCAPSSGRSCPAT